jgi:hypothetical protein
MSTNYWIFIVTDHSDMNKALTVENIFKQRMEDEFWGLGKSTPNRDKLKKGDRVLFYIGNPVKSIGGSAKLKTSSFMLDRKEKEEYGHDISFYNTDYGVRLEDIDIWQNKIKMDVLISQLSFIENKNYWYTYFQGGVRKISEDDYNFILQNRDKKLTEQIKEVEDLENEYHFALEMHLEEFMYRNWENINWENNLKLYQTADQDGRQFPADIWSIDFLAIDQDTDDLVVIELKRGKTSDSTVGQILRYISWVKENIADENQDVRGIIIGKESEDKLEYALKDLDYIDFKSYEIDFKLN